jgi:hypothetical protein
MVCSCRKASYNTTETALLTFKLWNCVNHGYFNALGLVLPYKGLQYPNLVGAVAGTIGHVGSIGACLRILLALGWRQAGGRFRGCQWS